MSQLLIVHHSQTGHCARLESAVITGACHGDLVTTVVAKPVREAGVDDVLSANAMILGTPENFGYISGAMKDFLDRVYYPLEGRVEGMPYVCFVSAGNDGTGACYECFSPFRRGLLECLKIQVRKANLCL